MRFLLDANLSPRLAAALHLLLEPDGHEVRHLTDKFAADTPDIEWMTALGDEGGWVVVSGDQRIHRNPAEREAWRGSRITAFFLARGWSKLPNTAKASLLLRWWPRMVEQARLVEPGAAFEIPIRYGHGRFRQLKR